MTARTPTKIKLLHGERRRSRLPNREPLPAERLPTRPATITDEASAVWDEVLDAIGSTGVLTPVDAPVLHAYTEAVVRLREAMTLRARTGPLTKSKRVGDGFAKSPMHQIVRDETYMVLRLAAHLGFTPSSRAGIRVPDDDGDELDHWLRSG